MSEQNIRGDGFYLNKNKQKNKETHPDFKGYLRLTPQQLAGLIQIYERSKEQGTEPVLQIDVAAWKRQKDDGEVFLYASNEIYTGPRKSQQNRSGGYGNSGGGYARQTKPPMSNNFDSEEIPF